MISYFCILLVTWLLTLKSLLIIQNAQVNYFKYIKKIIDLKTCVCLFNVLKESWLLYPPQTKFFVVVFFLRGWTPCPSARLSLQSCLVYKFLIEEYLKFFLKTTIVYDESVCHGFDPRSLGKFKVTRGKNVKFVSSLYIFYGGTWDVLTSHKEWIRMTVISASPRLLKR